MPRCGVLGGAKDAPPYFGRARTAFGIGCIVIAGGLAILGRTDAIVVGLFLGSGLLALGVEAGGRLLGR